MLEAGQVDLWITTPEDIVDDALLEAYLCLLDDEERTRQKRFVFAHLRHNFLVSHALVRWVLSQYAERAPEQWRFIKNTYGRPELAAATRAPFPLRFNLSHTRGMAVCAVSSGADVGVDVEATRRKSDLRNIARHFFAPSECAALEGLDDEGLRRRFFEFWTLKEAYIKARGMGLHLPLDGFAFALDSPIAIAFEDSIVDDPQRWRFALIAFDDEHQLAIAQATPAPLRITTRRCVPCRDQQHVLPSMRF